MFPSYGSKLTITNNRSLAHIYEIVQASNMLGKASKIGSGLFSKLKSGINDLTDHTLDYAAQKGWDQTLRSNVGINLPRSGPKHSQEYIINLSFITLPDTNLPSSKFTLVQIYPHPNQISSKFTLV